MPLAHTATSAGPNAEMLLLGAGMIVLALVFFFQKTASRRASLLLLVLGAAAITGAFTFAGSDGGDRPHDEPGSAGCRRPAAYPTDMGARCP